MSGAIPCRVSNNLVLKKMQANNPAIAPKVPALRQAYLQYHARQGSPTLLPPIGLNGGESDALNDVYNGETIKYGVRWIGEYRAASTQTYCPLCGAPNPSQLEHYLPRAHYPEFTVLSWNLVPTCAVCNPKRGHHAHAPAETEPLVHPYYESSLLVQPLFSARIIRPFTAVSFVPVTSPGPFAPQILARLERQIERCFDVDKFNRWLVNNLWKKTHANLSGIATQAEATLRIVRDFKIHLATTGMNSWDTMFFRALLSDDDAIRWLRKTPSQINA